MINTRALLPLSLAALWLGRANVRPAPAQARMMTVYLVMLQKGPAWTADESSPAVKAVLDAHMANMLQMWHAKKLIIAGPLEDPGIAGVFVFAAASLDEAKALAASDPGVKAGRFVPVVYPWWVEQGVLPEAGTYCAAPPPK